MRKLTAHYYLRPDGVLGKRPIVIMDDEGRITHIRETGNNFKEEVSLEYYPGILIPGFVASFRDTSIEKNKSTRSSALINGVLRLKVNSEWICPDNFIKAWSTIIGTLNTENAQLNLLGCLQKHTIEVAKSLNEPEWGVIDVGAKPGIMVLQNIDLRDLTLTERSSFRIIQK